MKVNVTRIDPLTQDEYEDVAVLHVGIKGELTLLDQSYNVAHEYESVEWVAFAVQKVDNA